MSEQIDHMPETVCLEPFLARELAGTDPHAEVLEPMSRDMQGAYFAVNCYKARTSQPISQQEMFDVCTTYMDELFKKD